MNGALAMITALLYGLLLHAGSLRRLPSRPTEPGNSAFAPVLSWVLLGLAVLVGVRFTWSYLRVVRAPEIDGADHATLRARRNNAIWSAVVLTLFTIALTTFNQPALLAWALPALISALAWSTCAVLAVRAAAHLAGEVGGERRIGA